MRVIAGKCTTSHTDAYRIANAFVNQVGGGYSENLYAETFLGQGRAAKNLSSHWVAHPSRRLDGLAGKTKAAKFHTRGSRRPYEKRARC